MDLAYRWAEQSKDPHTQVGCVIVRDKHVLVSGYNGLPMGVQDLPERMVRPVKYKWTSHAENNAVNCGARFGIPLLGTTLYVTHAPCCRCACSIIQAGIAHVVYGPGTTSMPPDEVEIAIVMFQEAGVSLKGVRGANTLEWRADPNRKYEYD